MPPKPEPQEEEPASPEEARSQEAARWLQQADADLLAARDNIASKHFNWAYYMAEQTAEKAVKAV